MMFLNEILPYVILGVFVIGLFIIQSRKFLTLLMGIPILVAFTYGIINPTGLLAIGIFWGLCELHWCNPSTKELLNALRLTLLVGIALAFANHLIPGFHNLRVITDLQISASSSPFTMYLNFDKTLAAAILAVTGSIVLKQTSPFGKKSLAQALKISIVCVTLLIPIAVLSGYVALDPKFPEIFSLWAFNNLLFVCFAEEVIFRGIIQKHLMQVAQRYQISPFVPILVTSILFGTLLLGHLQGGIVYITFATISGMFYGYAYHTTNRLEAAILVHFIVNLVHFLLFSYPMAATMATTLAASLVK
jgi:membrane protease YdiL (CAAX protease family)